MRKAIAFVLLGMVCCGSVIFADDAKTMPARVGRFYVAPTFAFANGEYNDDWEYEKYDDGDGALKVFNLGFAVEYGVLDWITAAVQWVPGWTIWSEVDTTIGASDDVDANGLYDLFVGAKIQIVGEKAPVKSTMFRAAIAPGVKIPLPGNDFEDEFKSAITNDSLTGANADKHAFGVGSRAYFDVLINKMFYINLYGEFLYFPIKKSFKDHSIVYQGLVAQNPALKPLLDDVDVSYGWDLTLELEPNFETTLTDGLTFSAGLPITFVMTPGLSFDHKLPAAVASYLGSEDPTYLLKLSPNVSFFLTNTLLPLEFKMTYAIPLIGQNSRALHSLTLQARIYFRI
ncbi:hypothetical protein [Breznakiella homolactica]|uniref:Transporter n=1 Tax=Breznakiella homolactica TaxID=2798577 RepID=A0A7T7XLV5_9SPIR|nr:hypothetical protein [Breznakiella homolactica]QQO08608.1 hypothetical protein JFL75_17005 [Breznakiella homolactica]